MDESRQSAKQTGQAAACVCLAASLFTRAMCRTSPRAAEKAASYAARFSR